MSEVVQQIFRCQNRVFPYYYIGFDDAYMTQVFWNNGGSNKKFNGIFLRIAIRNKQNATYFQFFEEIPQYNHIPFLQTTENFTITT